MVSLYYIQKNENCYLSTTKYKKKKQKNTANISVFSLILTVFFIYHEKFAKRSSDHLNVKREAQFPFSLIHLKSFQQQY